MIQGFIGRSPVYDRRLELFAYQLHPCSPSQERGNEIMLQLLQQTWEKTRLAQLTGGKTGFISLPGTLLENLSDLSLPQDRLIVCASWQALNEPAINSIKALAGKGYLIAIDFEHYDPDWADQLDFIQICSVGSIDTVREIQPHIGPLHDRGLKLLFHHVESQDQYDTAFDAGFDYFQGHFFERPRLIHGTHIPANKMAILQLIARLQDPDITIDEVEKLISYDITLSYKILRLINAAFYGLPKKVDSIQRAVVFFGLNRIKQWATVIAFNAIDYKPKELMITALVRAKTCETIARQLGRSDHEQCYLSGLFSLLDAIMDAPMQQILQHLSLTDDINEALLYGGGPIGQVLQSSLNLEQGICHRLPLPQLDLANAMQAYLEAIEWAEKVRALLEENSQ